MIARGWQGFASFAAGLLLASGLAAQEPPTFRAATERVVVDVAVVDDDGQPVKDLSAEDFTLTVDSRPRGIASVAFVSQVAHTPAPPAEATPAFSSNEGAGAARLVLIVVDQLNISAGGGRLAARSATELLDRLAPPDRVALLAFPNGPQVDFTTDRAALTRGLERVVGRAQPHFGAYTLSIAEAMSLADRSGQHRERVMQRECADEPPNMREACEISVENEAYTYAAMLRQRTEQAIASLRALVRELRKVDAPKTVIWMSEGMVGDGRQSDFSAIAGEAQAARVTLYVLHLDTQGMPDASVARISFTAGEDRRLMAEGLESVAAMSRGALFRTTGSAEGVFRRIAAELTGYYLLSFETEPGDRDGKAHELRVAVSRQGAIVRARRRFAVPPAPERPAKVGDTLRALLEAPLLAADVLLRVATYSLAPGGSKSEVLVAAEIGGQATGPAPLAVGFLVLDARRKVAASGYEEVTAQPLHADRPSPLHHASLLNLAPGKYTLRLGVVGEGNRRGSVEHTFVVAPPAAAALTIGDVAVAMVSRGALRALVTPVIDGAPVLAYADVRGVDRKGETRAEVEVRPEGEGQAVARLRAGIARSADGRRTMVQATLPLALLPPGRYAARISIGEGASAVHASRGFEIREPPAVDDTTFAADVARVAGRFDAGVLLDASVLNGVLARALEVDGDAAPADLRSIVEADALEADDLAQMRDPPAAPGSATAAMLRGAILLRRGLLEEAAGAFRQALRASSEFLPAIVYLGACYAAGGRDREAVGAWQTALVSESETPLVFQLAVDAFLRLGDAGAARDLASEAAGRWPDDSSIRERLALAHALGRDWSAASEALETLLAGGEPPPALASLAVRLTAAALAAGAANVAAARATLTRASGTLPPADDSRALAALWLRHLSSD